MNEKIRKNLARLASHLDLNGFEKFADEIDQIIMNEEDSGISLEKSEDALTPLDLAHIAKSVCDEIKEMIASYSADMESVISDLEYEDISTGETMLHEITSDFVLEIYENLSNENLNRAIESVMNSYDFIEHLKDESFDELCELVEEDILELE
tara:strand:+ start:37 stop:495 length:459 start_codon:yes stop_codon:yes gene_type:complete